MHNPVRGAPDLAERAEELAAACALVAIEGLGSRSLARLERAFGSARAILAAPARDLVRVPGLGKLPLQRLLEARDRHVPLGVLDALLDRGYLPVAAGMQGYPKGWERLHDPPMVAFLKGQPRREQAPLVAIVGTRRASFQGCSRARMLARELADLGVGIVSGLAEGIDGAAHEGALEASGHTIAVFGTPIDAPWPPVQRPLARRILEAGGHWISERPPGRGMGQGGFLARNRLVAAMVDAVVVVEAPARSGALHTLGLAAELGIPCFVMRGPQDADSWAGGRKAEADGATGIDGSTDMLEALQWRPASRVSARKATDEAAVVLQAIGHDLILPEQLSERLGWSLQRLTPVLNRLVLAGRVAGRGRCVFTATANERR